MLTQVTLYQCFRLTGSAMIYLSKDNPMLKAHFYAQTYHCHPADYLLMDNYLFSLNSLARRVGVDYENKAAR